MSYPTSTDDEMLAKAVRRTARSSAVLLASALDEWSRAFGANPGEILDLDSRRLNQLALCRRPRPDHWLPDARALAGEYGIEPEKLISLLRAAEAAEALRYAHPVEAERSGRLLAARDRDEEDGQ